eukprot:scaffold13455_cov50-Attheya_sp.AAC.10
MEGKEEQQGLYATCSSITVLTDSTPSSNFIIIGFPLMRAKVTSLRNIRWRIVSIMVLTDSTPSSNFIINGFPLTRTKNRGRGTVPSSSCAVTEHGRPTLDRASARARASAAPHPSPNPKSPQSTHSNPVEARPRDCLVET